VLPVEGEVDQGREGAGMLEKDGSGKGGIAEGGWVPLHGVLSLGKGGG